MLSEPSLKDSELRYRRLFEATQDGILILNAKTGMIEDVNPYLIKMLGYSREEFVEKKLWEVGAFKDTEASQAAFAVLQDKEYIRYEDLPLKAKDGRLIQVEFVSNVYLAGGEKIIQCNIRDITEHKRIIVALQANERKYFSLLNQSSDGIFIIDLSGNILTVNTAMCRELEFSQEEFLSMKIWDIFPKQYVDRYKARLTKILAGDTFEEPGEYEVRGRDGKHHYVEILSTPHYSGRDIVGFQGIARDITGRKQLQEKLRESEKKYRDLVEMTHDLIWAVDVEGRITYMSPVSRSVYGREPEEMIGHLYTNFVPPDEAKRGMAELASALAAGADTWESENRVNHRDGHEVVLSANAQVQRDATGNIVGMVGTSRDITARKLAEEALQASEARNRNLIEHLPTVVYMNAVGDTSSTLYVSPQIQTLLGYTPQEWLADPKLWSNTLHPEDRPQVLQQVAHTDQSREPFEMEYRMIARDGHVVWVHDQIVLVNDLEGNPQFWQGIMLDITERKQADIALQKEKDRAQQYLDIAGVIFLVLAGDRKVILINKKGCETLGYPEQDIVGQNWVDHFLPQGERNRTGEAFDQIMAGQIELLEYHENPILTKSGQERLVAWHNSALTDESGRTIGIVSSGEDITERRRAEESLRQSQLLLRATRKMARVGGWEFDVATVRVVWTEEVHEIHEVGPDYEQTISKWINLFESEARPVIAHAMQRAIDHAKPFDLELPIITGQGKRRWVHIMGQAQQRNGRATKLSGIFQDITERKQAEEALRESESSLQGILRSTADGILAANGENKTLFTNERFTEMWRIPQSVLDSKDDSLLIQHALDQLSDPVAFLKRVQDLYRSEDESFDTLYFKDGRIFERISHPLMRQQNSHPLVQKTELRGRVWSFRDVTTRKRAEAARDQLASIVDASQDAILGKTLDGIITSWNRGAERLYRYSADEAIGQSVSLIIPPDRSKELSDILDSIQHGEPIEHYDTVRVRKDGERIHVSITVSPILDSTGNIVGASAIARDITERKRADEQARFQATLLNAVGQAIIATDAAGIITYLNRATENLYGWRAEEAEGRNILDVTTPQVSQTQATEIMAQLSQGGSWSGDFLVQHRDGRVFPVQVHDSPVFNHNGDLVGIIGVSSDITQHKQAEKKIHQQLQHLTALRAIDQVIAANFDLKLSLSEILAHLTIELDVDAAAILLLNSSSQMLEYGAQRGFHTRGIKKLPMRLSSSYAGRVILERKPIQVPIQVQNPLDGQENLFLATPLEGEDFVFYYGVPLIAKGQTKGVLEVFHRTALEPDTEWFDFLYTLAGQAAIAIESVTLFESLQRSNLELSLAYDATIEGWSRALDLRDKETEGHTQRVTEMTQKLARAFGVVEAEMMQIRWGSLLHDIGKMGIPDGILFKPAALSDEEWVMMKKHPVFAYEMLSPIRYLQQSLDIPYCHHEKWDGTGYPRGLKGEMIPLSARLFAVVDVWDALCSDRPYRAGWPEEKVRAHIRGLSGTHFDPQVVDVFMHSLN